MRARPVGFIVLLVAMLLTAPAQAAGFLEMNFYMSGPRYDAWLPPCNDGGPLGNKFQSTLVVAP